MVEEQRAAPVGILVAVETEFTPLMNLMSEVVVEKHAGIQYYIGDIKTTKVVLCLCGIGRTNSASAAAVLCAVFKPKCVINSGSAGGLAPNLKIGDVVVADSLSYGDVDNRCFGYVFGQVPGEPANYSSSHKLLDSFREVCSARFKNLGIYCGQILTTESFVASEAKKLELLSNFPKAMAVEMEGCAVAHACKTAGVPSLVVRSISDTANDHIDYADFAPLAGVRSAEVTECLLDLI